MSHGELPVEDEGKSDDHWHVTRGIPVAFMVSMLIYVVSNIAIAAWFVSAMTSRVEQVERAQLQMAPQGERLTRVEEKLVAVQNSVTIGMSDIKSILQNPQKPSR
jgi:hypothetical protein